LAANYLDSLISSLGGESEGPDPSRLEGLVQLLRDEASDLEEPLQRVMSRIQEAGYKNIGLVTQQITDH